MLPNAFIGRTAQPDDAAIDEVLGPARALWDQLLADLAESFSLESREWNSYSPKHGWAMRIKRGKRNIVYLVPHAGCFGASFILGDKAIRALRDASPTKRLAALLDAGAKYPEGTGIRLEVKSARDIALVKTLTAAKLEH